MLHDPTEDGLALTVGIACVDKHVDVAAAHQSRDDLVLAVRALSRLTFHCQSGVGSMGSVSRLHLSQSWSLYSSGAARSTRWPAPR